MENEKDDVSGDGRPDYIFNGDVVLELKNLNDCEENTDQEKNKDNITETTDTHEGKLKDESESSKRSKSQSSRKIRCYPSESDVAKGIEVFRLRLVDKFNRKKTKYQRILSELGVNAKPHSDETDEDEDEEETEMIVSEKYPKARCIRNSFRFGNSCSFRRILRGIHNVIRRRKAMRITKALDSIQKEEYERDLEAVASELSIAYEYQIAMLADDTEVQAVADHAVRCMMRYLKSDDAVFNPTDLLEAVIEENPRCSLKYRNKELRTRIVKTDSFGQEVDQKWRLHGVLKQPGIRVIDAETEWYQYFGCFTPFGFSCRPDKYGFRGPLHIWNEKERKYTLIPKDMTSCVSSKRRKITYNPRNIHHRYEPTLCCCHDGSEVVIL